MYSSSSSSLQQQQHHKSKESNANRNILVRYYYENYLFFGYLCVGAEFLYVFQYMLHHIQEETMGQTILLWLWKACLPGCLLKQIINVAQLQSACYAVAQRDALQANTKQQ
uniref:Uncharacterized protein n=1 Tax=Cyclophora tenuis TaxID=216820 RepID=A0A7S1D5T8_CYCTE|mmetsp:Transcript_24331/g.41330  ORF Transcript_24331/g.41330 Transcript_24331/m.41330 type:complete len:111 (+) Transcript_24331:3-335(+)